MFGFDLPIILTLLVSIIAVLLSYFDMRRKHKQDREVSKVMAKLVSTLREELELFRKESTRSNDMTSADIERQKLLAERGKQQWNQLKDVVRAIGWFVEHAEASEEEEEY